MERPAPQGRHPRLAGAAEESLGDAGRAQQILDDHGWAESASEMVLVQREADVPQAAVDAAVADVVAALDATPEAVNVVSPLDGAPLVSADGRSALVTFDIAGDAETADERIGPVQDAVAQLLGDANWYLPRWLRWLPTLRHSESGPAAVPASRAGEPEEVPVLVARD